MRSLLRGLDNVRLEFHPVPFVERIGDSVQVEQSLKAVSASDIVSRLGTLLSPDNNYSSLHAENMLLDT